jgi:hypothetical protein
MLDFRLRGRRRWRDGGMNDRRRFDHRRRRILDLRLRLRLDRGGLDRRRIHRRGLGLDRRGLERGRL